VSYWALLAMFVIGLVPVRIRDLWLIAHTHILRFRKTTTVVELIQQAVNTHGMKVLVTAPSNVAVDNVLARLVQLPTAGSQRKNPIRAVRLGHPARIQANIMQYSLEALVQKADGTEIVADVRKELGSYLKILNNPKSRDNKRLAYAQVKELRKEVRTREQKVVTELLDRAQVVLATCVGAGNRLLRNISFDLVVIDEAAQVRPSERFFVG
jgi:superfamily I DNA and/or RNA helicase